MSSAPKTAARLGEGMTAQEWREHCEQLKQKFLAHIAAMPDAPFPNLPELRLPKSSVADLNSAGGETEGLVM